MTDTPDNGAEAAPILSARGLAKSFRLGGRSIEVLRAVDLDVAAGAVTSIVGASGAGKTTLLHLLGALDTPTAGTVRIAGREVGTMTPAERARVRNRRIGFIFQSYHLLPELDAEENVMLPGRLAGMRGRELAARARDLLGKVGLGDRMRHRPAELSGGEQQRVAIARALVNDPSVLLADEPTGNLDTTTGAGIMRLLASLHGSGGPTLVVVTHDSGIAAMGDRVFTMADGLLHRGATPPPAGERT